MCAADAYRELGELLEYPDSARLRRILEYLVTEEQARLVVSLPASPEELAQKLNMDVERVNSLSRDLYDKGVIIHRNFDPLEGFVFIPHLVFLLSLMVPRKDWRSTFPELADLVNDFYEAELISGLAQTIEKAEQPPWRVLPAYKAILDSPELLPEEDVRTILKGALVMSVIPCGCRVVTGACRQTQTDVCIALNRFAEYGLSEGMGGPGKALSYEEALVVIDAAEEAGLFHVWGNSARMTGTGTMLCSCCSCCCVNALPCLKHNAPISKWLVKSRYEARVSPGVCIGCRKAPAPPCIAICPEHFRGAIRMRGTPGTSDFRAVVDPEKCFGCGLCVLKCPVGAIKMELVRPADHIPGIGMPRP